MPACETVVNPVHENSDVSAALAIVRRCRICEFTTVFRDDTPQTSPVSARLLEDARILVSTSTLPKAFNIRRNPKVSLLFSESRGSRMDISGAVLIRGLAVVEDRMVIYVTLSEAWYWPGRDFGIPPLELDLRKFRHVASNR
jgi:hypothetical protein